VRPLPAWPPAAASTAAAGAWAALLQLPLLRSPAVVAIGPLATFMLLAGLSRRPGVVVGVATASAAVPWLTGWGVAQGADGATPLLAGALAVAGALVGLAARLLWTGKDARAPVPSWERRDAA